MVPVPRIAIVGATGYVGGQLLAALQSQGRPVVCLARRPAALAGRVGPRTEIRAADCLKPETLPEALEGVTDAYYLVHSLSAGRDFERRDREAARNFGAAARAAGVRRIVYLGGLGDPADDLSPHLRSRHETGDCLRQSGMPVIELRSAIVIGPGSLSYELVRALVERLPVMICPRWVALRTQPIAVEDLVAYLVAALDLPAGTAAVYEVGGKDLASYGELLLEYARQRGLRRRLISVPLLTPRLSSLWLALATPAQYRVGRSLVESLRNPTVVRSDLARRDFAVRPRSMRDAVARALEMEGIGPHVVDRRSVRVDREPSRAFAPIRRIGGKRGWYAAPILWRIRGWLDTLAGGPGLRRGRRDPEALAPGDAIDFWRVDAYEPDRRLRLAAEMRLPGRAWLEFDVAPDGRGSRITQTATFEPRGLGGRLYWYALYPVHAWIFRAMLSRIATSA